MAVPLPAVTRITAAATWLRAYATTVPSIAPFSKSCMRARSLSYSVYRPRPRGLSGVHFALVDNANTFLYASDVRPIFRPLAPHFSKTGLVCLENARYLGERLNLLDGISANMDQIKINMVFWKASQPNFRSDEFVAFMLEHGVKVYGILVDEYRFVTHNDVTRADIDRVIGLMKEFISSL